MIAWILQPDDTDKEDCFELQVNGVPLAKLDFLDLNFKLVDEEVPIFNGDVLINEKKVTQG